MTVAGFGSAVAWIDVDEMAGLVRALEDAAVTLRHARTRLSTVMARFDLVDAPVHELDGPRAWAEDALPDLRRRLALARAVEASSPTWPGTAVQISEVDVVSLSAEDARRAGLEIAEELLTTGTLDSAALKRLEDLSADPYAAVAFARSVTLDQLTRIVVDLDGTRPAVLAAISRALGTASYGTGELALPSTWATTWVEGLTAGAGPAGTTWSAGPDLAAPQRAGALAELLGAGGRFEPTLLEAVATGAYARERAHLALPLGGRPSSLVPQELWRGHDPMRGVMSALEHNPRAAARFLNPDGGGALAQERMSYLVGQRGWSDEGLAALTGAVHVGAAAWFTTAAPTARQTQSAWIASAAVHHLAGRIDRTGVLGGGPPVAENVAGLLATYLTDVDRVARGDGATEVPGTFAPRHVISESGTRLPVGADFAQASLNTVLRELLIDERAAEAMSVSVARFNGARLEHAVEYAVAAEDMSEVRVAVNESAALVGYLAGNAGARLVGDAEAAAERSTRIVVVAADATSAVPIANAFAAVGAAAGVSAAREAMIAEYVADVSRAEAQADGDAAYARDALTSAVGYALALNPGIPPESRVDKYRQTYPWVECQDGEELRALLEGDRATRREFRDWVRRETALEPVMLGMDGAFGDGHQLGAESGQVLP